MKLGYDYISKGSVGASLPLPDAHRCMWVTSQVPFVCADSRFSELE